MPNHIKKILLGILVLVPVVFVSALSADDDISRKAVEPITLILNFQVTGQFSGMTAAHTPIYTVGGPGYAPPMIYPDGRVSDKIDPGRKVADLANAQITFTGQPTDPILRFTCLPGTCTLTFPDGSVLQSNAGVALEGRAINFWGPVTKSPSYDPAKGIMPIRILGCGGLKEVAGKGRFAGMVGSICFNGILNFNELNPMSLTGASKCTITLHTPVNPQAIP
ncbi:MAG: hypothetical protein ACYDDO_11180 [Acidiferrobacterales bacterium]